MKARTIKIGNSQDIRIPKVVFDQIRAVDKTRLIRKSGGSTSKLVRRR
jgi:hypothetical protein